MADTHEAAAAPAHAVQAESSVEVQSAPKTDAPATEPTADKAANDGEDKPERNGDSKDTDARHGDRNGRSDRNDRNDRRDGGRDTRRGGRGGRGGGRGGRGGGNFRNKKPNDEFDDLPETDDPIQIRSQVEFYFSPHNLVTDEHLFKELDGPNNRPVSLKHITSFKRMRHFQPYSAVVDALRESTELVVVDDGDFSGTGKEAVKLRQSLVVPTQDGDDKNPPSIGELFYRFHKASPNNIDASVYVKGFGNDAGAGQIALEQFFRPFGSVMVRKRRDDSTGVWKGSVFVEFDTEENQKQFLALDPKPKFNDNDLIIMGKKEYVKMKCDEKGIVPAWERNGSDKRSYNNNNKGGDRDRGGRGGGRGRGRGGRGGRGGHRDDRRENRRGNNRSRSPRARRDRSGSVDSGDWNNRRDRFRQGKDDKSSRKDEDKKEPKDVERDAHGVPVIKDTRDEVASNKRKAGDEENAAGPKKSKLEIKQDE
ncbi:hypothetical protein P153DRAFT_368324 [Dothidotthia symphoricarpi CBS 119687]|uniref:HTH La-type RNA-binding domain-containing protein n=1 Tax=Dothidotthia symphoricarpi CBS 119687 TaxID=1392245 RepID=A0A6A6AA77_9PLEO|nr:uncharacterized protein P153DRAFT_368324 [Dothidotthia symphoricarpi CBS 119687]KAF2127768.1 hypothetical protein P153DRAFT_368324 [Dothidotthia symphoricarpi CBS 119687]